MKETNDPEAENKNNEDSEMASEQQLGDRPEEKAGVQTKAGRADEIIVWNRFGQIIKQFKTKEN